MRHAFGAGAPAQKHQTARDGGIFRSIFSRFDVHDTVDPRHRSGRLEHGGGAAHEAPHTRRTRIGCAIVEGLAALGFALIPACSALGAPQAAALAADAAPTGRAAAPVQPSSGDDTAVPWTAPLRLLPATPRAPADGPLGCGAAPLAAAALQQAVPARSAAAPDAAPDAAPVAAPGAAAPAAAPSASRAAPPAAPSPSHDSPPAAPPGAPSAAPQASAAAAPPLNLRADRRLHVAPARGKAGLRPGPVYVHAERIHGEIDVDTVLDGKVELRQDGMVLRADHAEYRYEDDEVKARGNVHLVDQGTVFDGPSLQLKIEAQAGQMPQARYSYPARKGSGEARLIEFLSQDTIRLHDATYTTCDPTAPAWWVRSERMDVHKNDEEARTTGSTLYFEGLPVVVWPFHFDFPLGYDRRSGFLTPGFTQSTNAGPVFSFPYYWNIAPNRDYTLDTDVLPQHGIMLNNELRMLEPHARGLFNYDVIPNDRTTGTKRDHAYLQGAYNDSRGLVFNVNFERVSDDTFLTDFTHNIVSASPEVLPQEGVLSYTQPYWNATLRMSKSQTLISLLALGDSGPYERVPGLTLNFIHADWHGFDVGTALDATRFQHPAVNPCFEPPGATLSTSLAVANDKGCFAVVPTQPYTPAWFSQDGSRVVLNPSISYPLLAPGWSVVPKLQWHYTAYSLDPNFHNGATSATRSLPIASLDSGLVFERPTSWLGSPAHQTLEPRLFYALVPYRNQSLLPNFDSADADFNFAQLFTENTFTGSDRIAQANQLTAAVTTRMIEDETGAERLRLAFGQRFYFGSQEVTLPGDVPRTNKASDTLFLGSASLGRKWSADVGLDYSTLTSRIALATFGFRWQPRPASVVNISYRYEQATLAGTPTPTNQPRISAQWPLSERWYGVGAVDYSISDRALAQGVAGFEYKADCWVARIALSRYAVTLPNSTALSNNYTTNYFLQIEFNGLSSVGFNPLDTLQSNIPGYQRINPPPARGGPFDLYE